jgi:glycosyltransferase involved in cell wall biosynthesis
MPRIGIDVSAAVTQGGGIGRYTRELVRALVNRPVQFHYRLFSVKQPAELPVPDPIPRAAHARYRQLPLSGSWMYRLWYRLRLPLPAQLATGPVDLFHSPDFVLPPVLGRIPTLLTVHDLSFVHFPEVYTPSLVQYLNRVVPWSVRRATHLLADSEATRDDLVAIWNVAPERITVLYPGVDSLFQPAGTPGEEAVLRRRYALRDDPFILAVGTVQPRKNYRMLIRAFQPLAAHFPHRLVIAGGTGWLYDEILAEVDRLGLADRVQFLGFVDDGDLPALYRAAALFAQPSLYEGFGLPVLEALACGTPALVANTSSLPEAAGMAAPLLPPDDAAAWTAAIARLLEQPGAATDLRDAGLAHAGKFRWTAAAEKLEQVYAGLLS